jgi:hypothetical protein
MAYAIVPMLLNLFLCWLWLQMFYIGVPWKALASRMKVGQSGSAEKSAPEKTDRVRDVLRKHYDDLGSILRNLASDEKFLKNFEPRNLFSIFIQKQLVLSGLCF